MNADQFYSPSPEPSLRFGDIINGFPALHASVESILSGNSGNFSIVVDHALAVVMNPCCSIRDGVLAICLLKPLDKKYFLAPKLKEDPLRLNEKIVAEDAMPPPKWKKLTEEERQQKINTGLQYAFNSVYVFAPHKLLPEQDVVIAGATTKVGHYEIDFRETCFIRSSKITKPETPVTLVTKLLQLSDQAREGLRNKLQAYYERVETAQV